MTGAVAEIVREVESAGGHLSANGDQLEVSAPTPLPSNLVNDLRENKCDLLSYLSGMRGTWDETDFRTFYDERAAIHEYDGELERAKAEQKAFEATIIQWINLTPPKYLDEDHCAQCGEPIGVIGQDAVPVLAGGGGHAWLHHSCIAAWQARRRKDAVEALQTMRIG